HADDLVWEEGTADWIEARTVKGLFAPVRAEEAVRADVPAPRVRRVPRPTARDDRPADDDWQRRDDRPGRGAWPRRAEREPERSSKGLVIGLIVGGLVAVIAATVIIIVAAGGSSDKKEPVAALPRIEPPPGVAPPFAPPVMPPPVMPPPVIDPPRVVVPPP